MDVKPLNDNPVIERDELSLKEILKKIKQWFKYLISNWLIIVIVGLIGGILGAIYANSRKAIYTATTSFVLEDDKSSGSLGSLSGLASMAGLDLGGDGGGLFQGENIIELYKSRTMIEKTLLSRVSKGSKQYLIDLYIQYNHLDESWKKNPKLTNIHTVLVNMPAVLRKSNPSLARNRDSVLSKIAEDIAKNCLTVTKPDKKVSIIYVDVKSNNELFSKSFNETIVANVNDFYVETKIKKSKDNISILQHKADSVRSVMNGAIYTSAAVADATPNLNPTRLAQRMVPLQRSQFSAEANKTILGNLIQSLEMMKINLLRETPLIQVIDGPVLPIKREKLGLFKGILVGVVLATFLITLFLLLKKIFRDLMHS